MKCKKRVEGFEYDEIIDCDECEGEGKINGETCLVCNGTGKIYDNKDWEHAWKHP